ncbi:MAG TPA: PPC domain-containing DNA-binding protein [Actinophytocola sp.]|nr:PPC domain-containing DNA-binding protein [Actinophytocola sp.]
MAACTKLTDGPPRVFAVVLAEADSVTEELTAFAADHDVRAASVTAIGAFRTATLGFFDLAAQEYLHLPVDEQAEVLSLIGDIGRDDEDKVALHAHAVLGLRDGSTRGGHLLNATVRPTLEVMVTESPAHLRRRYRPDVGLALIDLPSSKGADPFTEGDPLRHGLAP